LQDTTAPTIVSVKPSAADLRPGAKFTVTVETHDASPLEYVDLRFEAFGSWTNNGNGTNTHTPAGATNYICQNNQKTTQNSLTGIETRIFSCQVPSVIQNGQHLIFVEAYDANGYEVYSHSSVYGTIQITGGSDDFSGPELLDFQMDVTSVDASASATVNFSLGIRDESPVAFVELIPFHTLFGGAYLCSPGQTGLEMLLIDVNDGIQTWGASCTVGTWVANGDWEFQILAQDVFGNEGYRGPGELGTLTVLNGNDDTNGPELRSLKILQDGSSVGQIGVGEIVDFQIALADETGVSSAFVYVHEVTPDGNAVWRGQVGAPCQGDSWMDPEKSDALSGEDQEVWLISCQLIDNASSLPLPAGNYIFSVWSLDLPGFASHAFAEVSLEILPGNPTLISDPTLSGRDSWMVAEPGVWQGFPTPTLSYQWFRCNSEVVAAADTANSGCESINEATTRYRNVSDEDVGKHLIVGISATNSSGSAVRFTDSIYVVSTSCDAFVQEICPNSVQYDLGWAFDDQTAQANHIVSVLNQEAELSVSITMTEPYENPFPVKNYSQTLSCSGDSAPESEEENFSLSIEANARNGIVSYMILINGHSVEVKETEIKSGGSRRVTLTFAIPQETPNLILTCQSSVGGWDDDPQVGFGDGYVFPLRINGQ
jgi:hypothetical protein